MGFDDLYLDASCEFDSFLRSGEYIAYAVHDPLLFVHREVKYVWVG